MITKQKITFFTLNFGLVIGLMGAMLAVAFPADTAYAQANDAVCSQGDGGAATGEKTEAACKKAIEEGKDPCTAIYNTIYEDDDSTSDARDQRIICEDINKGSCSTEVLPQGYSNTRNACFEAKDNGKDPCKAVYDKIKEDDSRDNAQEDAQKKRYDCQEANGTTPDCAPGEDGCCGGVKTSIIGDLCKSGEGADVIYGLLTGILKILTAGVGIAAVGGIAYGALLYTTAENKPDQTKKAIGIITNVVIGIVAYGLMFVLLNFLIPGGIFTLGYIL